MLLKGFQYKLCIHQFEKLQIMLLKKYALCSLIENTPKHGNYYDVSLFIETERSSIVWVQYLNKKLLIDIEVKNNNVNVPSNAYHVECRTSLLFVKYMAHVINNEIQRHIVKKDTAFQTFEEYFEYVKNGL